MLKLHNRLIYCYRAYTACMLFCYMVGAVGVLDQSSQEYYISATQSHDKTKAIRWYFHPLQTLYFTGFSESQKYSQRVSKKVNVYKGLQTMRHEILCNFCYLFVISLENLFTKPVTFFAISFGVSFIPRSIQLIIIPPSPKPKNSAIDIASQSLSLI